MFLTWFVDNGIDKSKFLFERYDEPSPSSMATPYTLFSLSSTSQVVLLDNRLPHILLQLIHSPSLDCTAYFYTVFVRAFKRHLTSQLSNITPPFSQQIYSSMLHSALSCLLSLNFVTVWHIVSHQLSAFPPCSELLQCCPVPHFSHIRPPFVRPKTISSCSPPFYSTSHLHFAHTSPLPLHFGLQELLHISSINVYFTRNSSRTWWPILTTSSLAYAFAPCFVLALTLSSLSLCNSAQLLFIAAFYSVSIRRGLAAPLILDFLHFSSFQSLRSRTLTVSQAESSSTFLARKQSSNYQLLLISLRKLVPEILSGIFHSIDNHEASHYIWFDYHQAQLSDTYHNSNAL